MVGFLGGLSNGLNMGDINGAVDYIIKQQHAKRVAAALDRTMAAGGGAPQPAASPDPIAALARLKGGTGAPPQPAPAPQAGPAPAPFTPGRPPAPGQPDPLAPTPQAGPAPRPQPMPGQPTGAPGAEAPTGMAVGNGLADPVKEGQSLIQNLWQTIRAANPKADPRTILDAVNTQIDEIKGVAPVTKAMMQGQLQYMNFTMKAQEFDQREARLRDEHAQKMVELAKHHANQDEIAQENARFRGAMVDIARDRASYYGESVQYAHEDRQAAEAGRNTRSAANIDSKMSLAQLKEAGLNDRSAAAIKGRHGAAIASGVARVLSYQPSADMDSVVAGLEAAYGDQGGGGTPKPAAQPHAGGGVPANVQQFAKQHGLTIVRKRADGKYDAKTKDGTVGVIG